MPFIRKIEARAYSRATEVPERVGNAILGIFPEEVREHVTMTLEDVEGQVGDQINIVTGLLKDRDNCQATFDFIIRGLERKDRRNLLRSLDLRISEKCVFFLRIDKQRAFLERISLADSADVIRVRIYFRIGHRCKKEDVLQLIEDRLQNAEG